MRSEFVIGLLLAGLSASALVACDQMDENVDLLEQEGQSAYDFYLRDGNKRVGADFDGDGYDDVAIGADNQYSSEPVLVYYGSASGLGTTPGTIIQEPGSGGAIFGRVGYAGDVNDDGYDDLAVGAPDADSGGGAVYIFFGSSTGLAATPSQTLNGSSYSVLGLGFSVCGARDLNNDGYSDLIAGAPGTKNPVNQPAGRALVFLGGPTGLSTTVAATLNGSGDSAANFGYDIATAELNSDQYTDVVITENYYLISSPLAVGRAYVFLGNSSGVSSTPSQVLTSPDGDYMNFGVSVANVGDFDDDLYADIVIGAYRYDNNTGRAYLYRGNPNGVGTKPYIRFQPPNGSGGYFGWTVAGGDMDDDGYSDVVIGETDALGMSGRVHVHRGHYIFPLQFKGAPIYTDTSSDAILTGTHSGVGYFGSSMTAGADVNGDDHFDALIGANAADGNQGRFYVFNGGTTIGTSPSQTFTNPTSGPSGLFGSWVSH